MTVEPTIRLTKLAKRAGCAAKHPPGFLLPLLGMLPPVADPNVLIGSSTADDAAVYRLSDSLALVLTTDFFTPIVDQPRDFGQVAAANALSDVYAMGGKPLTALSLVGFPENLPAAVLGEILRGAADKTAEAGIAIVGGHTIKSEEPIFGLAVVGTIHPDKVLANAGARPGDSLILTKPIGLGVITTAAKNDQDQAGAITEAVRVMTTLNRAAAEVLARFEVHALTDVTGFGLLGHLRNMTAASKVTARIWADQVPVLSAARQYVAAGIAPGGTRANWRFLADWVEYAPEVSQEEQLLLCDAQTSGGLLAAVPAPITEAVVGALNEGRHTGGGRRRSDRSRGDRPHHGHEDEVVPRVPTAGERSCLSFGAQPPWWSALCSWQRRHGAMRRCAPMAGALLARSTSMPPVISVSRRKERPSHCRPTRCNRIVSQSRRCLAGSPRRIKLRSPTISISPLSFSDLMRPRFGCIPPGRTRSNCPEPRLPR